MSNQKVERLDEFDIVCNMKFVRCDGFNYCINIRKKSTLHYITLMELGAPTEGEV